MYTKDADEYFSKVQMKWLHIMRSIIGDADHSGPKANNILPAPPGGASTNTLRPNLVKCRFEW